MRHYKWEGLNHVGLKTQGEIEAFSTQIAKAELRKQGVFMLRIHQKRTHPSSQEHFRGSKMTREQTSGYGFQGLPLENPPLLVPTFVMLVHGNFS